MLAKTDASVTVMRMTQSSVPDDQDLPIPSDYNLSQNYPNPFNAATIILYELLITSTVTIDIYDILGRKVQSLVSREEPVGYHDSSMIR